MAFSFYIVFIYRLFFALSSDYLLLIALVLNSHSTRFLAFYLLVPANTRNMPPPSHPTTSFSFPLSSFPSTYYLCRLLYKKNMTELFIEVTLILTFYILIYILSFLVTPLIIFAFLSHFYSSSVLSSYILLTFRSVYYCRPHHHHF